MTNGGGENAGLGGRPTRCGWSLLPTQPPPIDRRQRRSIRRKGGGASSGFVGPKSPGKFAIGSGVGKNSHYEFQSFPMISNRFQPFFKKFMRNDRYKAGDRHSRSDGES